MVVVNVSEGKLRGAKVESDNGFPYYEFLGIPYAKPPTGELRFKSPQPPEPWDGERDATTVDKKNICFQMDMIKGNVEGSEDCLYLNVYTPNLHSSNLNLLPVMFYIHGGGYKVGNGIDKADQGPEYLIENNVVVVTINYRLGVFGFLQLGIPEAAGNMGLKDQVQALKWVQANIDKFGGDRNNVTIFGISAGSASVEYQILSPLAKGLFHKAILQSGSSLNHWAMNFDPKRSVLQLIEKLGYNGNTDDNHAIYDFLCKSPASLMVELSSFMENYSPNKMHLGFVPTIEKDFGNSQAFMAENPYKILKEGKFNRVPVIKGFCNKEGYLTSCIKPDAILYVNEKKIFLEESYDMDASDKQDLESRLLAVYTENLKSDDLERMAIDFFGDFDFVAGIWLSGEIMESLGLPLYVYEFCHDGAMNLFKRVFGIDKEGAAHGDDTAYLFKHSMIQFGTEKDISVRTKMTELWTNFAKTGVPSADTSVKWPQFKKESLAYLSIGEDLTIKYDYEPKKMAIFREIYEKYGK